ncbi:hypothetical protein [aff. Roholtiella sp. LEGE 12411]|uniref:hypothetical protein n=1 Tax=aff. Roholtiella sp. LEGE 12411 TaxID=1828822 RepID=UPI001881D364|nr:hypothetical protein [aff. Roholtiella sp. LEGE 12411]MBE9035061.1 hypothetical protein [aff. Roholtiella sp. LEGE 12411]
MNNSKARISTSSVFVIGLSYTNTSGAGSSINVISTSPLDQTISQNKEVFIPGAISNRTTVAATDSFIRSLISINSATPPFTDKISNQEADFFGNSAILSNIDPDILIGTGGNNYVQRTEGNNLHFTDLKASGSYGIDIVANNIVPKNLLFSGFDSTDNAKVDGILVPYQDTFLSVFGGNTF